MSEVLGRRRGRESEGGSKAALRYVPTSPGFVELGRRRNKPWGAEEQTNQNLDTKFRVYRSNQFASIARSSTYDDTRSIFQKKVKILHASRNHDSPAVRSCECMINKKES